MYSILLLIHALLAGAIVVIVLIQRSDSDGFGMGSGGAGGGGVLSSKAKANFLTRSTALLAASFMATSLALAVISVGKNESSLLEESGEPFSAPDTMPETYPESYPDVNDDIVVPDVDGGTGESPVIPFAE